MVEAYPRTGLHAIKLVLHAIEYSRIGLTTPAYTCFRMPNFSLHLLSATSSFSNSLLVLHASRATKWGFHVKRAFRMTAKNV